MKVVYSIQYLELDLISGEISEKHAEKIRRLIDDIAQPISSLPRREEERAKGRYGRWITRIGIIDVLIAVLAKSARAILATGDWDQARFYMSLTGRKSGISSNKGQPVIYIPPGLLG